MRDEDDLRAALRTLEQYAPDPAAMLDAVRAQQPGRGIGPAQRHPRGHTRWLGPLAAAAAVLAIVAGSLIVAHMPAGNRAHHRLAVVTAAQLAAAGVPAYYVTLNDTAPPNCCRRRPYAYPADLVLRSTMSGAAIATVRAPRPYVTFVGVTATADDRTFVVAAQRAAYYPLDEDAEPATRFYALHVRPGAPTPGGRAWLTPLPIPVQPQGTTVGGMAVSPDGSKLAVISAAGDASPETIHVFSMTTGALRRWSGGDLRASAYGSGYFGLFPSWAGDSSTLAFIGVRPARDGLGVMVVHVAAKGNTLASDARRKVHRPVGVAPDDFQWRGAVITPDGSSIIAVQEIVKHFKFGTDFNVYQRLVRYSARTGKPEQILSTRIVTANYEQVLWTSRSGDALIVGGTGSDSAGAEIYVGHRWMALRWSAKTLTAAW